MVVVGYPATSLTASRARFCVSSAHTPEDVMAALKIVSEVGNILGMKVSKRVKAKNASEIGDWNNLLTMNTATPASFK